MSNWLIIVLLFFLWSGVALIYHSVDRRYYLASFYSAVAIVIVTQVVSYIETGTVDPLWFVSSVTSFFLGFILAMLIGMPFRFSRIMKNVEDEME